MTVSLDFASKLTVRGTLTGPFVDPSDATYLLTGLNEAGTYDGSSTVPVTKVAAYELALSSGVGSINLAALVGLTAEEVVVGTGLKAQFVKFKNKVGNANKIKVAKGASNGYGLCASGDDWHHTMNPGQSVLFSLADAAPDVASDARLIDVTGTGAQVLQIEILLG